MTGVGTCSAAVGHMWHSRYFKSGLLTASEFYRTFFLKKNKEYFIVCLLYFNFFFTVNIFKIVRNKMFL